MTPVSSILLLALGLGACRSAEPSSASPPPPEAPPGTSSSGASAAPIALFPGVRKLCSQHVSGNVMHIEWTAYATERPIAEVVAFYEENGGDHLVERDGVGIVLRGPSDQVLSVHPKDGSYPRCEVAPSASDATVIIVSRATR